MPTIKLVVIGSSGVGKTSLRGQYISGRFTQGYRATIGADFITKTLPHPTDPEGEKVTLQIWDTAGQERFSSLSAAFFRGADAALLLFDVNTPATLTALRKWWADFCAQAPVEEEERGRFCVAVVGNKIDLDGVEREGQGSKKGEEKRRVTKEEARNFVRELIPLEEEEPIVLSEEPPSPASSLTHPMSDSITIHSRRGLSPNAHLRPASRTRTRPQSQYGTLTSTHSGLSTYHTPASSVRYPGHTPSSSVLSGSVYESARSSPEPWRSSSTSPPSSSSGFSPSTRPSLSSLSPSSRAGTRPRRSSSTSSLHSSSVSPVRQRPRRSSSASSGSSSGMTITPRLFLRGGGSREGMSSAVTTPEEAGTTPEKMPASPSSPSSPSPLHSHHLHPNNSQHLHPHPQHLHPDSAHPHPSSHPLPHTDPHHRHARSAHAHFSDPPPADSSSSSSPLPLSTDLSPSHPHQEHPSSPEYPPSSDPGTPPLFFTSAKTGAGVPDVFTYIAARVVRQWEEEAAAVDSDDEPQTQALSGTRGRRRNAGRRAANGHAAGGGVDLRAGVDGFRERVRNGLAGVGGKEAWRGEGCCAG